jgi:hypothetical protein
MTFSGVDHILALEQHDLGFGIRHGPMFGSTGHDDQVAGPSSTSWSLNSSRKRPFQPR